MTQRKVLAALAAVGVLASPTAAHAQTGRAAAPATAWADTQAFVGFSANGAFFDNTYVMSGVWAAAADFSLALRPRFRVHRMLQLRAYWGLSVAHTGDTTTRNEASLSDATVASLRACDAMLIVSLMGVDETSTQTVHARTIYSPEDLRWNERFVDIISRDPDGHRRIDYRVFHDTQPMEPGAPP